MKVALVLLPVWYVGTPPIGLAYLNASLKKYGHVVSVFDFNIEAYKSFSETGWWNFELPEQKRKELFSEEHIRNNKLLDRALDGWVRRILSTNPGIICFSIYRENERLSVEVARRIKNLDKSRIIVFGGAVCRRDTPSLSALLKECAIDVFIFGEGESVAVQVAHEVEKQGKLKGCQGTIQRFSNRIIDFGIQPLVSNLDSLPYPDYTGFSLEKYTQHNRILIVGSRGCHARCVFCIDRVFWRSYRTRSAKNIFDEIVRLNTKGYSRFEFCDSIINGDIEILEHLCDYIINSGIKCVWSGPIRSRPDMTLKLLKKMSRAGCCGVNFGVESGSQRILNLMRKGYNVKTVEKNLKDMTEAGITTCINIIVGFPGETEDTLRETVDFIRRNHNYIKVISSLTPLYLLPTSELMEKYREYNLRFNQSKNEWKDGWSSMDGKNTLTWRLEQCTMLYHLIESLNIKTECGQYRKDVSTFQEADSQQKWGAHSSTKTKEYKDSNHK